MVNYAFVSHGQSGRVPRTIGRVSRTTNCRAEKILSYLLRIYQRVILLGGNFQRQRRISGGVFTPWARPLLTPRFLCSSYSSILIFLGDLRELSVARVRQMYHLWIVFLRM